MIVTGPSLTRATCIIAPKTPVSTCAPRSRSAVTTASTSGSATGPGAAADQVGRRPLRASPYRVNWLITSSGAPMSAADRSSRRMRSSCSLRAMVTAVSAESLWVTPSSTSRPGPISPMTVPSTVTLADSTLVATARTAATLGDGGGAARDGRQAGRRPGAEAAGHIGGPGHAQPAQRVGGQAGGIPLVAHQDDAGVRTRLRQPPLTARGEPPLQDVALHHQRARDLSLGGPERDRPDVHQHGAPSGLGQCFRGR